MCFQLWESNHREFKNVFLQLVRSYWKLDIVHIGNSFDLCNYSQLHLRYSYPKCSLWISCHPCPSPHSPSQPFNCYPTVKYTCSIILFQVLSYWHSNFVPIELKTGVCFFIISLSDFQIFFFIIRSLSHRGYYISTYIVNVDAKT